MFKVPLWFYVTTGYIQWWLLGAAFAARGLGAYIWVALVVFLIRLPMTAKEFDGKEYKIP